jgi:ketosteroid isomerase-like protein
MKLLKKVFLLNISAIIITFVFTLGCQQQATNTKPVSTVFDIQKAKSFIDSINTKFSEQIMNGDSVALASHYAPDAELLFSNSEPIKGKDIVTAWGSMIRSGTRNMTFTTTDLAGCDDFLIETGYYEIKGNDNKVNKGKYVVVWKKQNGEWKLYRDIGN